MAYETIVTGALPVEANPDVALTFVQTGGTHGVEIVNLPIPANPGAKVGAAKRFILNLLASQEDQVGIDVSNLVNADGQPFSANDRHAYLPGLFSILDLEIVCVLSDPLAFAWQVKSVVAAGVRTNFLGEIRVGNTSTGQNAALLIEGGASDLAEGGNVLLVAGRGVNRGGDVIATSGEAGEFGNAGKIMLSGAAGGIDGGDIVMANTPSGTGRQGLILFNTLPQTDPAVPGAAFDDDGMKVSHG